MELRQIRYFVALSRWLNFTRAAERCNITQPALTKAIQRLEGELGGELIYRERQFTKLMELGKLVLPRLNKYCRRRIMPEDRLRIFGKGRKHRLKLAFNQRFRCLAGRHRSAPPNSTDRRR
jgi:DNA-binding transcriptional LysR family regulator